MAVIDLRNFGGMQPSANAKLLPNGSAVLVRDLELRFGDFRPLLQPNAVGVNIATGKTLYRFKGSDTFVSNPGVVNYVRGPIPSDALERTYYTGDGTPKVITMDKQVRQLGVPASPDAPGVFANVTDKYSADDAATAQATKLQEMIDAVRASYSWPFVGLRADEMTHFVADSNPDVKWSFDFVIPGTMNNGTFTPLGKANEVLIDGALGFHLNTLADGKVSGLCPLDLAGQKIVMSADDLSARLSYITDPSDATKKLLRAGQIEAIRDQLVDALKPMDDNYAIGLSRLKNMKDQFVALADTGSAAKQASIGAMQEFYLRPDVTSAIDTAVKQAVSAIFGAMFTYNNASYTAPASGGGGNPYTQQPA